MQLCQMCAENEDIVLLKVDWDQNKAIARPLGVKVTPRFCSPYMRLLTHAMIWACLPFISKWGNAHSLHSFASTVCAGQVACPIDNLSF